MSAFFYGPLARTHALPPANRAEREAKVASQRQLAFKGPLLDEREKREFALQKARVRMRDEGLDGLFQ